MAPIFKALPCILAAIAIVHASSLRGVAPERQHLYQPTNGQWECLDHSKTIPATAINDDYCDCPDGSDEPGTSACPNSVFYCENKGHIPAYIKSWAVDDGVCDEACCDGSDETSGQTSCPNVCEQKAADYARMQAAMRKIQTEGAAAKSKLVQEAESTVRAWQDEKSKLEDSLAIKRAELLRRQQEIDALEASAESSKVAAGTRKKCPPCNAATLSEHIRTLEDEIDTLITILKTMKRDHNHNFHDMAVKAAIAGYDEFIEGYDDMKYEIDKDLTSDDHDFQNMEEADDSHDEQIEVTDPVEKAGKVAGVHSWLEKIAAVIPPQWRHLVTREEVQGTAALEAARTAHSEVNDEIQTLERSLQTIKDDLAKDYGEKHEWLKLKDTCVEKNEGEYTYSVCLFGNAYQKSNKDGARINLGRFDRFLGDEHKEQIYHHGTKCWNGPERSVHATFECGPETEITEVTEPEKCEYRYKLKIPVVCPLPDEVKQDEKGTSPARPMHEEL